MADQSYLSIYAKSFNWAGFFLPKQTFLKCSSLYDFCRVADNIADSNEAIEIKKINAAERRKIHLVSISKNDDKKTVKSK